MAKTAIPNARNSKDESSDVLVVGGGAMGCSTAWHLAKRGMTVRLIERRSQGGVALLDAILAEVHQNLAGAPQPDDVTLLTASVLGQTNVASRQPSA